MSTLTDANRRKFEELLFSPAEGGGSPDRASGDACGSEGGAGDTPGDMPDGGAEESSAPAPDRASGTGCVNG